jgi:hypothetical protein
MVGLADLIAIFHDASSFTIENNAVLLNSNLVNDCGFGK